MSKKNIVLAVALVIIVVGVALWVNKTKRESNEYSVVYLITGEIYVGKLSIFPNFELKDSYILSITKDAVDSNKSNFQLNPINEALWSPESLYINKKNVVFYG